MLGRHRDADTTFEQPTTIAPSEQPVAIVSSDSAPDNAKTMPIGSPEPIIRPLSAPLDTTMHTHVGEARQPNRFFEITLVGLQFVLLLVIAVAFFPTLLWQNTILQIIGSGMMAIGLALGIWAIISFRQKVRVLPSPGPSGFLVTGGPYAFIRHPMYSALLLVSFGLFLAYPTIIRILAIGILAVVLLIKMRYEEHLLAARYNGYDTYVLHTGRIFPQLFNKIPSSSNVSRTKDSQ